MDLTLGSLELLAFLGGSVIFYNTLKKQQNIQQTLEFMTKATVFSPSLLKKVMSANGPLSYLKSLHKFQEGKDYSEGYAFLEGYVKSDSPIRSTLDRETEMVISNISTESIFSNNSNKLNEGEGSYEARFVNEFELGEIGSKGNLVRGSSPVLKYNLDGSSSLIPSYFDKHPGIINLPRWKLSQVTGSEGLHKAATIILNGTVNYSQALHFVDSTTYVRSLTGFEKFLSWALFCVKLFLSMSNVGKRISGFRVGSRKIERGILLGQFVVLYGKVFFDRMNQQLKMVNPQHVLQDKVQLINKLKRLSIKCSRNLALMSFLMALFGTMFTRRVIRMVKDYLAKLERVNEIRRQDKLHKISELTTDDFKCIFCRRLAKNVIVRPCLHMFCCEICYDKKAANGCCAICNKSIKDKINIFVA